MHKDTLPRPKFIIRVSNERYKKSWKYTIESADFSNGLKK